MSVYKRGQTYWYKFLFQGQLIRDSAKTNSKTVAREAERARRRELELAVNRIPKRDRTPLFAIAAREWLASKSTLAPKSLERFRHHVATLSAEFGHRLVCDITADDVLRLRSQRVSVGLAPRTVNYEIAALRGILKSKGFWSAVADELERRAIKKLPERHDVGRAISAEDEQKLLAAIAASRSPALLPLFILAIDTGLRASELRSLTRRDLSLVWEKGTVQQGALIVKKSKTDAGTGRLVPLTSRACAVLSLWFSRFPNAEDGSYVFPRHRVGLGGDARKPYIWDISLDQPIGEWKKAWRLAFEEAGVRYRWHDCRHSFISRLAENPHVSQETIKSLAGHVSKRMLERYSHIRTQAKRDAIVVLDGRNSDLAWAHDWAQSRASQKTRS
jgi:integrase